MSGESILERVMLAFEGDEVPRWVEKRLAEAPVAGVTLFMAVNVLRPGQVRALTEQFQRAGVGGMAVGWGAGGAGGASGAAGSSGARGPSGPLLVAADQEGGQLNALGADATQFAGNMALGAVGDTDLTERVGAAIGREARAMGVNVVYAPVLDLATEPNNSALGIRSYGDDPTEVGRHGAAMVRGLQSAGVAATVKHFPGLGDVSQDTHHALGVVAGDAKRLETHEFVPFAAAFQAGAKAVMSAHIAVPALTGDSTLPATLSRVVMGDTLRGRLGFRGITISDALDMHALAQGAAQAVEVIAAIRAGIDLLLTAADRPALRRIEETLSAAAARNLFEPDESAAASARLAELRSWLAAAGPQPDLDVVGSAEHRAISRELAERSLTRLDRATDGTQPPPIAFAPTTRWLAIMPEPLDLTPADTSSAVPPGLGRAMRTRFASVDDVVVSVAPDDAEIARLRGRADSFDAVVVGTIEAHRQHAQAALVRAIAETGVPTVAVALRTPWDAAVYPPGVPAVATYSILPDALEALARALAGEIGFTGRLPVARLSR
ncbi:MAG: glycoside hydrolase family 3 N-terminal domain-containing protein [Chloroflexota bacterium]